jgi:hypothetical protein
MPWIDFCRWPSRTDLSHSSMAHGIACLFGPRITVWHNERIRSGLGCPIERRRRVRHKHPRT